MPTLNKIRSALTGAMGRGRDGQLPSAAPVLRRLRLAITAFFALDGFIFAGWVVRIPAIKEQTAASPSALGLALLGVSAGGLVTMMLTGRLCRRFGNHPVTVAAGTCLSLSIALPPQAHSALVLGLVLLVFGGAYGAINVAMNAAAVDLVRALGRPVMPSFHAAFSLGGMLGSGLGGLLAGSLTPTQHLLLLTAAGLVLTAVAAPPLLAHRTPPGTAPDDPDRPAADTRSRTLTGRARQLVLMLGLIALCTAYGEGALADWSALHLSADLHASAGVAAVGYSVFALAMTVGRLSGTALLERLGPARVLVVGGALSAAGMLLAALAPAVWLVLAGFVVTGLGLANIFPVAIARAGSLAGPSGVAAASTLGYGGFLLGPVAIGFLTDWASLPLALCTVAALCGLAGAATFVGRRPLLTENR